MNSVSPARLSWATALTVIAAIALAGGTAFIGSYNFLGSFSLGVVLVIIARSVSKMKLPKLALSSLLLSAILVVVIFVLAVAANIPSIATATPTSDNAIALIVLLLLWLQHAVTILLVIGLIIYIVRLVRARREAVAE